MPKPDEPHWLASDKALAVGRQVHDDGLCPGGCGHPIEVGWNPDNDGWFDAYEHTCYACTAKGDGEERKHTIVVFTRPDDDEPLPFDLTSHVFAADHKPKGGDE